MVDGSPPGPREPRPMSRTETPRVVVVGAGFGGVVSALLLACRGLDVTLVESADGPGGKMRPLQVDGAEIDAGPTVMTMRWVFDELLAEAGASAADLPPLAPLQVLARHAWADGGPGLDLHADRQRSIDAIAAFSSPAEARRFEAFSAEAARVYRRLEGPYIRSGRPTVPQMIGDLGARGLATLFALGPGSSLMRALGRRLHDPRLQQLFGRYATYCGGSPWLSPATLMLVAHVEQQGVFSVQGGMAALARAVADLAQRRGARLRYGTGCAAIDVQQGRVVGVRLHGGERLAADAVVFNGDASAVGWHLPEALRARAPTPVAQGARSLSAVTWAVRAPTEGFALQRHNVFFDSDYASEFDDIFQARRLPKRGTVYLCAQDRTDDPDAPAVRGAERLLMLVNAPADGDRRRFDASETDPCQDRALALLRRCGLHLQLDQPRQVMRRTPADFARLFPGSGGALYGPATHGWTTLFRRPSARTAIAGLFLAGGSVHPGPGVPMAAMSGRLAAATLMAHLDSTHRWRRVHISGGTSMRSATTAAMP
jgi:1-hydroxycarotenoid 3,4-desaturase